MAFDNLPYISPRLIDGNLIISVQNNDPKVLVLGTAPRGPNNLYTVDSVSDAARVFGRADGTLVRGLYEVAAGGATNIRLLRIGAKAARLANVGGGITVETVAKDGNSGDDYTIFWDDSAGRLRVWRVRDNLLVYDNSPAYPAAAVDENEVSVWGSASGSPGDIGTLSAPLSLRNASGVSGAVYTDGTDGINLSRLELFEELFQAYKLLENEDPDIVVPRNVYLDDANVMDMTNAEVTALNLGAPWDADPEGYPMAGSEYDALGRVFAQEHEGSWYFWWDMDRDGVAEIYPAGVGLASATKTALGEDLEDADFHEANFGYQLANFCFEQSENHAEVIGAIGTLPPNSWSLKDVSLWVGKAPIIAEDSAGNSIVVENGTGLLGNKWMAGRKAVAGTGLPGHTINNIDGLAAGGFIATDNGWPDGSQQKDRNERLVDLGKYISVVGGQAVLSNPTSPISYAGTAAGVYAGFVASLPENSAPTNKVQPGVRLPFRISVSKLDALAGKGYVMLQGKPKGIVVADAPTASRPDSDYQRLTTIRIVKATINAVRNAGEPYLGEPITGPRLGALETAISQALVKLQKAEFLQRFDLSIRSTPQMQVQGKADVELVLVPAFELRQITVYVALAAQ